MIELEEARYNELLTIEKKYNTLICKKKISKNHNILIEAVRAAIITDRLGVPKCAIATIRKELPKLKKCSDRMIRRIMNDLPVLEHLRLIEISSSGTVVTLLEEAS